MFQSSSSKKGKLKGHLKALNEQFAAWIQQQRASNSLGVWSAGCKDYIKYVSDLEKEFGSEIDGASGNGVFGTATAAFGSAAAPGGSGDAGAGQLFMFGTGDCGQLGLGEDVPELPFPKQIKLSVSVSH